MAIFITLLVVACFVTAGTIHKKTYRHPRDVTGEYRKDKPAGEAGEKAH